MTSSPHVARLRRSAKQQPVWRRKRSAVALASRRAAALLSPCLMRPGSSARSALTSPQAAGAAFASPRSSSPHSARRKDRVTAAHGSVPLSRLMLRLSQRSVRRIRRQRRRNGSRGALPGNECDKLRRAWSEMRRRRGRRRRSEGGTRSKREGRWREVVKQIGGAADGGTMREEKRGVDEAPGAPCARPDGEMEERRAGGGRGSDRVCGSASSARRGHARESRTYVLAHDGERGDRWSTEVGHGRARRSVEDPAA